MVKKQTTEFFNSLIFLFREDRESKVGNRVDETILWNRDLIKPRYAFHKMRTNFDSRSICGMEFFRGLPKFLINFLDLSIALHPCCINDFPITSRCALLLKKKIDEQTLL